MQYFHVPHLPCRTDRAAGLAAALKAGTVKRLVQWLRVPAAADADADRAASEQTAFDFHETAQKRGWCSYRDGRHTWQLMMSKERVSRMDLSRDEDSRLSDKCTSISGCMHSTSRCSTTQVVFTHAFALAPVRNPTAAGHNSSLAAG